MARGLALTPGPRSLQRNRQYIDTVEGMWYKRSLIKGVTTMTKRKTYKGLGKSRPILYPIFRKGDK